MTESDARDAGYLSLRVIYFYSLITSYVVLVDLIPRHIVLKRLICSRYSFLYMYMYDTKATIFPEIFLTTYICNNNNNGDVFLLL